MCSLEKEEDTEQPLSNPVTKTMQSLHLEESLLWKNKRVFIPVYHICKLQLESKSWANVFVVISASL